MRWFRGAKNADFHPRQEGNQYSEMAYLLFEMHRTLTIKLIGERRVNKLSSPTYAQSICETLSCLLHYIDRTLFATALEARDERMDRLVLECDRIVREYLESMGHQKSVSASNYFLQTYEKRATEYAGLGDDWLRKLGLKYARHLMESLSQSGMKDLMKANFSIMYFMGEVTKSIPEFFKP